VAQHKAAEAKDGGPSAVDNGVGHERHLLFVCRGRRCLAAARKLLGY
jgi:hypothetical protein